MELTRQCLSMPASGSKGPLLLNHSSLAVTKTYLRRLEGQEDKSWARVAALLEI
jgi:hypothetical protein